MKPYRSQSLYFFTEECYSYDFEEVGANIWSNFMRAHIGLKVCHFLLSAASITSFLLFSISTFSHRKSDCNKKLFCES